MRRRQREAHVTHGHYRIARVGRALGLVDTAAQEAGDEHAQQPEGSQPPHAVMVPEQGQSAVAETKRELARREQVAVRRARHHGLSWAEIGTLLGVTRQTMHRKYGKGADSGSAPAWR